MEDHTCHMPSTTDSCTSARTKTNSEKSPEAAPKPAVLEKTNNDDDDSAAVSIAALYQLYQRTPACPCPDRNETVARVRLLLSPHTPPHSMPYGEGPTVLSEIVSGDNLVLGIDEAGRGSLIGPMIYGMVYWSVNDDNNNTNNEINKNPTITTVFGDSKQLNEKTRDALFEEILQNQHIGFGIRVISASEISRNMLRPHPYNLNQMSHDAAIALIRSVYTRVTSIHTCYIDTVGNPQSYQKRLEQEFPGVNFVVESKADDKYAPCSAASIVAKVTRDAMLRNYTIVERTDVDRQWGCGYPSDPACKLWVEQHLDTVFGFPEIVRFSWAPAKQMLATKAKAVAFAADEDGDTDEDEQFKLGKKRQQQQMKSFLSHEPKRLPYFQRRGIRPIKF